MAQASQPSSFDWRDGFLFIGNQLALDFLNTRPVQNGKPIELLPDSAGVLGWFQAAGLLSPQQAARMKTQWREKAQMRDAPVQLLKFREKLRREVQAWESGRDVDAGFVAELNRHLASYPMRTRLKRSVGSSSAREARPLTAESYFDPQHPNDLLAPLVQSAAELFALTDRSRVRQCSNCVLHFLDTSKKGTRHWCSMQLCGNRIKVAAYAARKRQALQESGRSVGS